MPLIIPAADAQNITWDDLVDRMNQVGSLANGAGKRLNMQTDGAGNVTLSANTHIPLVSSSGPQRAATDFMKGVLERKLGAEAGPTIAAAGLPANGPWPGNCAAVLNPHVQAKDLQIDNLMAGAKWQAIQAQNNQAPDHPGLTTPGVAQVLNDPTTQARISGSGAGKAIIAMSPQEASGGMIIKSEEPEKITAGELISQLGRDLQTATNKGLPFDVVEFQELDSTALDRQAVARQYDPEIARLQDLVDNGGLAGVALMTAQRDLANVTRLKNSVLDGSYEIGKMELVPNSVQLNQLPVAEKVALFKSPEFAQKMGQAMAVCPMLGLDDHIGPVTNNNASNFLINPTTGVLTAIDYAAKLPTRAGDLPFGSKNTPQRMTELKTAVDNNDTHSDHIDKAMDEFFLGEHEDSFFCTPEEVAQLTQADKDAFRQNLLTGIGQGMDFVGQNIASFEQGYQQVADSLGIANQEMRAFMPRAGMEQLATTLNVAANLPPLPALDGYSASDSEYSTSDSELSTSESELSTSESELSTSESELSTSESELSTSESELSTSESELSTSESELSTSESEYSTSDSEHSTSDDDDMDLGPEGEQALRRLSDDDSSYSTDNDRSPSPDHKSSALSAEDEQDAHSLCDDDDDVDSLKVDSSSSNIIIIEQNDPAKLVLNESGPQQPKKKTSLKDDPAYSGYGSTTTTTTTTPKVTTPRNSSGYSSG